MEWKWTRLSGPWNAPRFNYVINFLLVLDLLNSFSSRRNIIYEIKEKWIATETVAVQGKKNWTIEEIHYCTEERNVERDEPEPRFA